MTLRVTNQNPRSINEVLGNMNSGDPDRSGEWNNENHRGYFRCIPHLNHAGEQVYLCSSTLSGHAVLLPHGGHTAIARVALRDTTFNKGFPEARASLLFATRAGGKEGTPCALEADALSGGGLFATIRTASLQMRRGERGSLVLPVGDEPPPPAEVVPPTT